MRPPRFRIGRADWVLVVLLGAHVLLQVLMFRHSSGADPVGDEKAYLDAARSLSNALRDLGSFGPVDGADLERNVVGNGWFMPGMSLLLTPLFLVLPDASMESVRGYLGLVSTALFLYAAWQVRRVLGPAAALCFAVLPGLIPAFALFGVAAWGDLNAGLVLVVVLLRAVELARVVAAGSVPTVRQVAGLAGWAVAALYLRSSMMPALVTLGLLAGATALWAFRGRERRRAVLAVLAGVVVFVSVLLPWSLLASASLGGRVVTTTSVPLALANTFGDRDEFCFGPCDPAGTIWFNPVQYSREVARATGRSELEIQEQMSAYARRDVTLHSYAGDVLENLERYRTDPAFYLDYLPYDKEADRFEEESRDVTDRFFTLGTIVVVLALLLVSRGPRDRQVQVLLVKVALGGLLFQPFVHMAGSRYWTTAAAVAGLALGVLVTWGLDLLRELRRPRPGGPPDDTGLRVLTLLQALLAVGAVGALAGLHLLA
ncbi:MAG TPA: hypothetical protein VMF51_04490 [Nocardioides sp.]|uniref:hypothetical protein n=1 Tax=Nocardioides sp. TaxID=35761 RepID=UPI002B593F7E|nr:hypothetical protein [Nocardioides sp.]HTW14365.1 hypothetical protein [Nocardioides sp.]